LSNESENMDAIKQLILHEEFLKNPVSLSENGMNYIPPGWEYNGLNFEQTIKKTKEILKNSKKSELSGNDLRTTENAKLLRSCYTTPDDILSLGNYFIGKYDFDPYWNPYSLIKSHLFSENLRVLDGTSKEKDGFNIKNWNGNSLLVNPPFIKLKEGAYLCIEYSQQEHSPGIAFICNLDYTNYLKECIKYADYLIMLGRVFFKPLPGIEVSSPTGSSVMVIFNSKKDIKTSFINEFLCIDIREIDEIKINSNPILEILG